MALGGARGLGRERTVYAEKYRKGALVISTPDNMPTFRHTNGLEAVRVEILEAGKVERNGHQQEYQILKVYFKP